MGTSNYIAEKLIKYLDLQIDDILLEPSAGEGFLAEMANGYLPQKNMTLVELNHSLYSKLIRIFPSACVMQCDFLHSDLPAKFTKVIAVPPYANNTDCEHIRLMYDLLVPGGRLASLTYPAWTTGFYKNQIQFRKWLNDVNFKIEFIEDTSYMNCPKAIIIINKPII